MSRDFTSRRRQVLVVDAAPPHPYSLVGHLHADGGYLVDTMETAATCTAWMADGRPAPDAILLAVELPDGDGAELCVQLRDSGVNAPILLIAENADEAQIVRGLDMGANDVIITPLRPAEALARLRAQIRAYETSEDAVLSIGQFQFRPAQRLLQNNKTGARIKLTEKEAAVLKFLYRSDRPVPRNTLLHEVWGYNAGATTHTVETHIYRLRRKIEPDSNRIGLLVNEDGGYRLRLETPAASARPRQPSPLMPAGELGHFNRIGTQLMLA